ncbi:hypothetical protein [Consotaella aegiceratis]|uniref:hypothetical protein n=1 Tax=Consotaella aegiceratis TaxID=3097961 RepID=UPI002F3FB9A2
MIKNFRTIARRLGGPEANHRGQAVDGSLSVQEADRRKAERERLRQPNPGYFVGL